MTEQTKKQIAEAKTVEEKIKAVNQLLHDGEPGNISVDTYSGYSGYKPQHIIDAMNAVFGIGGWGFDELSAEVLTTKTEKGTTSLAIAQVKVWKSLLAWARSFAACSGEGCFPLFWILAMSAWYDFSS